MKKNMSEVSYKSPKQDQTGSGWWSWNEWCDKCGKVIHTKESMLHSCPQDESQPDYCVECLRSLIDDNIPYEQTIAEYPVNGLSNYELINQNK